MNRKLIKNMKKIRVFTKACEYPIFIGKSILEVFVSQINKYDKMLILTNNTIFSLYDTKLNEIIKHHNNIYTFKIPDGEKYKNFDTANSIYDFLFSNDFTDKSCIISFGGGVICDIAGFIASTYVGGIDFIQIPTSLASQIDSSIVNLVSLNHTKAKNLIGVTQYPKAVIIDIDFLDSLPQKEFLKGIKKAVKYSIMGANNGNFGLFNFLEKNKEEIMNIEPIKIRELIEDAYHIKKSVFELNEFTRPFEDIIDYKNKNLLKNILSILNTYNILDHNINTSNLSDANDITEDENLPVTFDKKAVIDIGTNSTRLLIANVLKKGNKVISVEEIERHTEIVRLGEDVNRNHYLKQEAIKRTVNAIKKYKEITDKYAITDLKAFATSAVRDATNRDEFLEKVRQIPVKTRCISGEEEGILNFTGNSLEFQEKILVVDIGGGSTEFSLGENNNIEFIKSIDIGAVRGTEKFFKNGYTEENMISLYHWAKKSIDTLIDVEALKKDDYKIVAVAGTATAQISVRDKMEVYDPKLIHLSTITLKELEKNLDLYLERNRNITSHIIGLDKKREEIIAAGTMILITIMKELVKDTITVSEKDNLVGALMKL
ncbi:iron-containing alcohol dehydrogenase [Fusobacterium sp. PH5-44]|uniref:iron-containing alcohol dehydrogenase n=1 Tax=unclassified Fusobacterium TaxID=2648384 RepID=UPI003D1ECBA1